MFFIKNNFNESITSKKQFKFLKKKNIMEYALVESPLFSFYKNKNKNIFSILYRMLGRHCYQFHVFRFGAGMMWKFCREREKGRQACSWWWAHTTSGRKRLSLPKEIRKKVLLANTSQIIPGPYSIELYSDLNYRQATWWAMPCLSFFYR